MARDLPSSRCAVVFDVDGPQVALGSSAKEDELAEYKKIFGIDDLIEAETSFDDAETSKPCPDIFEAAVGWPDLLARCDA